MEEKKESLYRPALLLDLDVIFQYRPENPGNIIKNITASLKRYRIAGYLVFGLYWISDLNHENPDEDLEFRITGFTDEMRRSEVFRAGILHNAFICPFDYTGNIPYTGRTRFTPHKKGAWDRWSVMSPPRHGMIAMCEQWAMKHGCLIDYTHSILISDNPAMQMMASGVDMYFHNSSLISSEGKPEHAAMIPDNVISRMISEYTLPDGSLDIPWISTQRSWSAWNNCLKYKRIFSDGLCPGNGSALASEKCSLISLFEDEAGNIDSSLIGFAGTVGMDIKEILKDLEDLKRRKNAAVSFSETADGFIFMNSRTVNRADEKIMWRMARSDYIPKECPSIRDAGDGENARISNDDDEEYIELKTKGLFISDTEDPEGTPPGDPGDLWHADSEYMAKMYQEYCEGKIREQLDPEPEIRTRRDVKIEDLPFPDPSSENPAPQPTPQASMENDPDYEE